MTARDDEVTATAPGVGLLATSALSSDQSIGSFIILGAVGSGGMGHVYAAYDPRLDRRVAIKVLHDSPPDRQPSLLAEARALARLAHPNVVSIHETGVHEGRVFIVMEFVDGPTLHQWHLAHPSTGSDRQLRALELVLQAGRGLAAAHDAGLVHCDFKPSNVLVGSDGRARVADFGVARRVQGGGQTARPSAEPRAASRLVGTPSYMAPEQRAGRPPSARSDQYAYCLTLREILTGSPHADAQRRPPGGDAEGSRLPPLLRRAIRKGLAERPSERHVSMAALLAILETAKGELIRRRGSLGTSKPTEMSASPAMQAWLARAVQTATGGSAPGDGAFEEITKTIGPAPDDPGAMLPAALEQLSLAGRDSELQLLHGVWRDVCDGAASVGLLRGAPGSGKTRLAEALLLQIGNDCPLVLRAKCRAWDPEPFSLLRQLLRSFLRDCASAEQALQALGESSYALLCSVAPEAAVGLDHFPSTALPISRRAMPEELANAFVAMLSAFAPTVVFIDDLQWIDEASRDLLHHALRRCAETGALFLLTCRDDAGSRAVWRALGLPRGERHVREVELGRLPTCGIAHLVRSFLLSSSDVARVDRIVEQLSDGTPLGAFEVLRSLIESEVLKPEFGSWRIDPEKGAELPLRTRTFELITERTKRLSPEARTVLLTAAVAQLDFDDPALPTVCELDDERFSRAVCAARSSGLLSSPTTEASEQFGHALVRESLLSQVDHATKQSIHQRVAEALDRAGEPDGSSRGIFTVASHFAAGRVEKTPQRTFELSLEAAGAAFAQYDNYRALEFYDAAIRSAAFLQLPVPVSAHELAAEASLRCGRLDRSRRIYEQMAREGADVEVRAIAWSRVAFVHRVLGAPSLAWAALERAFDEASLDRPRSSLVGMLHACATALMGRLRSLGSEPRKRAIADATYRLRLYLVWFRLAADDAGRGPTTLPCGFYCLKLARIAGTTAEAAEAYAGMGAVCAFIGLTRLSDRYLRTARAICDEVALPHLHTCYLRLAHVSKGCLGDMRRAIELGRECLNEHGQWLEHNDALAICASLSLIEAIRGKGLESAGWMQHAIRRIQSSADEVPVAEFYLLWFRSRMVPLGRSEEANAICEGLTRRARVAADQQPFLFEFCPRIAQLTECGRYGDELEALLAEFRRLAPSNPRRAHRVVYEVYVHLAHARVHQLLGDVSSPRDRQEARAQLRHLEQALRDLRRTERLPLMQAHRLCIEGFYAWFRGKPRRADRFFRQSESVALDEDVPWVLYAVARGRAHMARARGEHEAAQRYVRAAIKHASDHGLVHRVRWIREEFEFDYPRAFESDDAPPSAESSVAWAEGD